MKLSLTRHGDSIHSGRNPSSELILPSLWPFHVFNLLKKTPGNFLVTTFLIYPPQGLSPNHFICFVWKLKWAGRFAPLFYHEFKFTGDAFLFKFLTNSLCSFRIYMKFYQKQSPVLDCHNCISFPLYNPLIFLSFFLSYWYNLRSNL